MTTDLFGTSPAISSSSPAPKHRGRRAGSIGIAAGAAVALFLGGLGATASADIGDDPGGPSNGHALVSVNVGQGILLTGINDLALTGASGEFVQNDAPESFNVKTNSVAGYTVTVAAADSALVSGANSIPINYLQVSGDGVHSAYVPFVAGALPADPSTTLQVHTQAGPSAIDGDNLENNYQMDIPGVPAGTYTVTLDYIATVQ